MSTSDGERTGAVDFLCFFFRLSFIQLKQYLSRFANFDRDKDGLISIEDMVLYLRVPQDVCAESVFNSLRPVGLRV